MSDEEFEDYDNTSGSSLPEEFRLAMGRAIIDDEPEERLQGKLLRDSERDKRRKKLQGNLIFTIYLSKHCLNTWCFKF